MSSSSHVVFLHGPAVDRRVFAPISCGSAEPFHLKYIPPFHQEPLASYAQRLIPTLPAGPILLVGFSFGGAVALELAQLLGERALGVILISSFRNPAAVTAEVRRTAEQLPFFPDPLLAAGLMVKLKRLAETEGLEGADRELLQDMASRANLKFVRWAGWAIAEWDSDPASDPRLAGKVRQIQGGFHMSERYEGDAEVVIAEAGHLLPMTHPEVVEREILAFTRTDSIPFSA
jgi:pimeloyl-ACP methyl ester carboxylesterase